MCRSSDRARLGLTALVGALVALPSAALAQSAAATGKSPSPLTLARLSVVEHRVELGKTDARWQQAVEGGPLALGEALRTGPEAVARLDLPWMALTLSPGSTLRFPDSVLLQATLEAGRVLVEAPQLDALKLVTDEAEVRGQGRAVVRRQAKSTLVTCLAGRFLVEAAGAVVTLTAGQGTVVAAGTPSAPQGVLPLPAEGLWPAPTGLRRARRAARAALEGQRSRLSAWRCSRSAPTWCCSSATSPPPGQDRVPGKGFRWRVSARTRAPQGLPRPTA
jgi:hypothetical protein